MTIRLGIYGLIYNQEKSGKWNYEKLFTVQISVLFGCSVLQEICAISILSKE